MHPYKKAPPIAFWSRAVSSSYSARALISSDEPLLRAGERVATAGSCFASNLVPYLERSGFTYLRTEQRHPSFAAVAGEAMGYDKFSAAYGNIYTVRQLLQLFRRSLGQWRPAEDRWHVAGAVIDPYRPGLKYFAQNDYEFDALTVQHLAAVKRVFKQADVFIFTLGLTEAWVSIDDGAVFPVCPGTIAGRFDPERHSFRNFDVAEITADLNGFISEFIAVNPNIRIILTVSPVPLVATATGQHVLRASTYSKSVLRVAAEAAANAHDCVTYFPAYEIVTGPQAPADFFEANKRNVSQAAVEVVMDAFLFHCDGASSCRAPGSDDEVSPEQVLSQAVVEAECEELMLDSLRH